MDELFDISKPVSFRLPLDTAQPVQDFLSDLKRQEGRKYGSACASLFVSAINEKLSSEDSGERVVLHLPGTITPEQRDWLDAPMTKQMLGQWIYQMLTQPGQPAFAAGPGYPETKAQAEPQASGPVSFQIENSTISNLARNLLEDDE